MFYLECIKTHIQHRTYSDAACIQVKR